MVAAWISVRAARGLRCGVILLDPFLQGREPRRVWRFLPALMSARLHERRRTRSRSHRAPPRDQQLLSSGWHTYLVLSAKHCPMTSNSCRGDCSVGPASLQMHREHSLGAHFHEWARRHSVGQHSSTASDHGYSTGRNIPRVGRNWRAPDPPAVRSEITTPSPVLRSVAATAEGICNSSKDFTFRMLLRNPIMRWFVAKPWRESVQRAKF
mgnify:CR=1 FL=1